MKSPWKSPVGYAVDSSNNQRLWQIQLQYATVYGSYEAGYNYQRLDHEDRWPIFYLRMGEFFSHGGSTNHHGCVNTDSRSSDLDALEVPLFLDTSKASSQQTCRDEATKLSSWSDQMVVSLWPGRPGVPPVIIDFNRNSPYKPSINGGSPLMENPKLQYMSVTSVFF